MHSRNSNSSSYFRAGGTLHQFSSTLYSTKKTRNVQIYLGCFCLLTMTLEMLQLIRAEIWNQKNLFVLPGVCFIRLHMKMLRRRKFGIPGGCIELLCKAISSVITCVGYVIFSVTFFTHLKNGVKLRLPASVVSTFSIASEAELTYGLQPIHKSPLVPCRLVRPLTGCML